MVSINNTYSNIISNMSRQVQGKVEETQEPRPEETRNEADPPERQDEQMEMRTEAISTSTSTTEVAVKGSNVDVRG